MPPPAGETAPRRRLVPSIEALVALVFFVAAAAVACSDVLVDDEGYLTYLGGYTVSRAPIEGFFFQKIHPATSLIYAPVVGFGFKAFLLLHVLLSAAAVYLLGATARRVFGEGGGGNTCGGVTALVVALSPLYFVSAASGQSNASGSFFLALSCFLFRDDPRSRLAAGIVAAAAVWSRYEQLPYLLALLGWDLAKHRDFRFAIGFGGSALAYLGVGAIYFGSLLWPIEAPPAMVQENMPSTIKPMSLSPVYVGFVLSGLLTVTPLWLLPVALAPLRTAPPLVRGILVMLVATAVLQFTLPIVGHLFNYDHTARYSLNHLPYLALLAGWFAVSKVRARRAPALLVALAGVAVAGWLGPPESMALGALPFYGPALLVTVAPRARAVMVVGIAALVAWPAFVPLARMHTSALPIAGLRAVCARLEREAAPLVVYTNAHQLHHLLERPGKDADVRFLAGYDQVVELGELLGPTGGNHARTILDLVSPRFYGGAVWPCEFPRRIEAGSFLVLVKDGRAKAVYALDEWIAASEFIGQFEDIRVYRAASAIDVPAAPRPLWLNPSHLCLPCARECTP